MDSNDEHAQTIPLRDLCLSPTEIDWLHKELLECLRLRIIDRFKILLEKILEKGLNVDYVYPNEKGKTCLDIACNDGYPEFVRILLENGANVNRINEDANYAPIHFATAQRHVDVLRVLLESPMVNPNLYVDIGTALHIAAHNDDLKCAELLLEKGARPNVVSSRGLTPLHMAAVRKNVDMVKLILDKSDPDLYLDLDSYRDYNEETTRDVLKRQLPDLDLPPPVERRPDVDLLIYHLIRGDEKSSLECLEKISNITDIGVNKLIEVATERNLETAVSKLLARGTVSYNLEKAATIAIRKSSPHILSLLLNKFTNIHAKAATRLLFAVCNDLGIPGCCGSQNSLNRLDCLRLVLERNEVDVRCVDEKGNTPLHYAARADNHEAVTMLLAKGSYIGHANAYGSPAIADIFAPTLSKYFDDSIRATENRNEEYMIEFDYKSLKPHDDATSKQRKQEMDVFQYLAGNTRLKHLLKHPLLSSFICLKWQRIVFFSVVSFALHLILYGLLNAYIIRATVAKNLTKSNNRSDEAVPTEPVDVGIIRILTSLVLGVFALWKLFYLVTTPRCFVKNLRNWSEVVLLVFEFLVLYDVGPVSIAVPVTLLSAGNLIMMGQYPFLSTDIEILKTVFLKFLRSLAVYGILIFAFSSAFFVLFQQNENFLNPFESLFKTIIMLAGEFNADEIPFKTYPYMSHVVFALFIFLIFIVLLNLLNGLAVNDIAEIIGKAELVGLISRIGLISYVEKMVISKDWILLFPKCLKADKFNVKLYNSSKMDSCIMNRAREILSRKNRESDTDRILGKLDKVKKRLTSMDASLNALTQALENNNVNVRRNDGAPS